MRRAVLADCPSSGALRTPYPRTRHRPSPDAVVPRGEKSPRPPSNWRKAQRESVAHWPVSAACGSDGSGGEPFQPPADGRRGSREASSSRHPRIAPPVGCGAAIAATPAHAASYAVAVGTCGQWTQYTAFPGHMSIFGDCVSLTTWNLWATFTSPWGVSGYWRFDAPPSTVIGGASIYGNLIGRNGWRAEVQAAGGTVLDACPGAGCAGGSKSLSVSTSSLSTPNLFLAVSCLRTAGCSNNGPFGRVEAGGTVYVVDSTSPSTAITGGDLVSGWRRLRGVVSLTATDNVGIKLDRLLVDGVPREQRARACRWGARIPCPNGAGVLSLDTTPSRRRTHADSAVRRLGQQHRRSVLGHPCRQRCTDSAHLRRGRWREDGWRTTNASRSPG